MTNATRGMDREPEKVGEPTELFPRRFGKTAFVQKFRNPRTGATDEYLLFNTNTRPMVIFALTTTGEVIVLQQFRYAAGSFVFELPGGNIAGQETPENAARRELREETGLEATSLIRLAPEAIWFDPSTLTTPFIPFLATNCVRAGEPRPEQDEYFSIHTLTPTQWFAKIHQGEVRDAKSIVTTFLAQPHLRPERRSSRAQK